MKPKRGGKKPIKFLEQVENYIKEEMAKHPGIEYAVSHTKKEIHFVVKATTDKIMELIEAVVDKFHLLKKSCENCGNGLACCLSISASVIAH